MAAVLELSKPSIEEFATVKIDHLQGPLETRDFESWETMIKQNHRYLFKHSQRIAFRIGFPNDAEDGVQHAWMNLFTRINHLSSTQSVGWERAYLTKSIGNYFRDRYRKERARGKVRVSLVDEFEELQENYDLTISFEDEILDRETNKTTTRDILKYISNLPSLTQAVMLLRFSLGASHRQIAETLHISPDNAKATIHRGKTQLQKIMAKKYNE